MREARDLAKHALDVRAQASLQIAPVIFFFAQIHGPRAGQDGTVLFGQTGEHPIGGRVL